MNARCSICEAVFARRPGEGRCPECGARATFQSPTSDSPRHAKRSAGDSGFQWDFGPDGPVLRRIR
jgi:hypothetical protein